MLNFFQVNPNYVIPAHSIVILAKAGMTEDNGNEGGVDDDI